MKKRKFSIKVWFPVLALLFLGAFDLILDLDRAKRMSGIAVIAVVGFAIAEFAWDTFTSFKQAVEEDEQEVMDSPERNTPITDATTTALGGLDWLLHKINPDYDPDAERNARNADPDALRKRDDMKAAGLIDEKEYQARKEKMAGK